jgi:hypothetical protein
MSAYPGYLSPAPAAYNPVAGDGRTSNRTPSPTPSEIESLKQKTMINYHSIFQKDKLLTKKYLIYYVVGTLVVVIGALFIFYHDQIVEALQPAANWMHGCAQCPLLSSADHVTLAIACPLVG